MRRPLIALLLTSLIAPAAQADPTAHTAVSVRTAKRWIRKQIRHDNPTLAPGSLRVGNCRHGYSRTGRHRVLCDTYFEKTNSVSGYCGWGRVVTMSTFYKVQWKSYRC